MRRILFSVCRNPFVRIVCLSVPVLTLFGATTLGCAVLVSWRMGTPLFSVATMLPSVVCGLVVWLFVAAMHLKRESAVLPVDDVPTFRQRLRRDLVELGYVPMQLETNCVLFQPSFTSHLLGGWMTATFEQKTVRLVGPKDRIEQLVRRLRLGTYVQKDHKSATTSVLRHGKKLVKRAQINFRVSPEQWQGLQEEVLRCLTREGAEVLCDVSLLAHSAVGIRAATIDGVRDWLRARQIQTAVQKEYVSAGDKSSDGDSWQSDTDLHLSITMPTDAAAEAAR